MSDSPKQELSSYVSHLHKEYEIWYAKNCRLSYRVWYSLQMLVLLTGFATSILVALQSKETWSPTLKTICVILPAIGSLAATIILQFKVFETWKLREEGRIAFQNLVNFAKAESLVCKTDEDCKKLYDALVQKTHEIESDQSQRFFSLYGSNLILTFGKSESK